MQQPSLPSRPRQAGRSSVLCSLLQNVQGKSAVGECNRLLGLLGLGHRDAHEGLLLAHHNAACEVAD